MRKRLAGFSALLLVMALAILSVVPAAGAAPGGATWDTAQWMSCRDYDKAGGDWYTSGKIAAGENKWFAFLSRGGGVSTAAILDSNGKSMAGQPGVHFHVWSFLKQPFGLTLTEIGQGTTYGYDSPYGRKSWRGGSDGSWVHYFQVKNQTDVEADFYFFLDCHWPLTPLVTIQDPD